MDSSTAAVFLAMREGEASRPPAAFPAPAPALAAPPVTPQPKRRRNQPGNPNPDAEVIALSPRTLMATNRFICEVCNKGFQREQNLQLHRRGHNLPWKLKQKSAGVARRKVYLCPETSCVHHNPSRALGDLTGIKKHYSRKHGEKKFKCEKCSKKYAVQSDWKAHSKTCGTREYRCDCGTLFSRRDSFITHRAFCDALAQETAARPPFGGIGASLFSPGSSLLPHPSLISGAAPSAFRPAHPSLAPSSSAYRPPIAAPLSSSFFHPETQGQDFRLISGHIKAPPMHGGHGLVQLSDLQTHSGGSSSGGAAPAPGIFNLGYFPSNKSNSGGDSPASSINILQGHHFNNTGDEFSDGAFASLFTSPPHPMVAAPHMSATALLQKAAQLGSSSSTTSASLLKNFPNPKLEHLHHHQLQFGGGGLYVHDHSVHDMFASIQGPPVSYASMGLGFGNLRRSSSSEHGGRSSSRINVAEGMTRDFLGMRAAAGSGGGGESSADRKGGAPLPPPKGPAFGVGGVRFK